MKPKVMIFIALFINAIAFVLFLGGLLMTSCNKDSSEPEPTCVFDDPLTDLPWLKEIVEKYTEDSKKYRIHFRVLQYTYRDEVAFFLSTTGPLLDCMDCPGGDFLNCEGEVVCGLNPAYGEFCKEFYDGKLIYETKPTPPFTIEDLYEQPLSVIKECVYGKWKLRCIGRQFYYSTFVNISENSVIVFGEEDLNYTFSYIWREMDIRSDYTTYVMWNVEQDRAEWFFERLDYDNLIARKFNAQNSYDYNNEFSLDRIIDNNQ